MNRTNGILPVFGACAIVAIVFIVLIFAVPLTRGEVYWTAVIFGGVSIAVALVSNIFVIMSGRSATSALYRTSVSVVSIGYMVVACAASFVFMLLPDTPTWVVIVVQVILLALCLAGLLGGGTASSVIERGEAATRMQTAAITTLRAQAESLKPYAADPLTRQALDSLCEALRYTDPMSSQATIPCDQRLMACMSQLGAAMQNGDDARARDLCEQMGLVIQERAALCRQFK